MAGMHAGEATKPYSFVGESFIDGREPSVLWFLLVTLNIPISVGGELAWKQLTWAILNV